MNKIKDDLFIDGNGNRYWYKDGKHHRDNDMPAIEWINGGKEWWLNGLRHREDDFAVLKNSGEKAWFLNGKLHREDGPAIENIDGYKGWFINGQEVSEQEVMTKWKTLKLANQEKNLLNENIQSINTNHKKIKL